MNFVFITEDNFYIYLFNFYPRHLCEIRVNLREK